MTERRTMEEAMEAIERVEEALGAKLQGHGFVATVADLGTVLNLAKRSVREPSESDVERASSTIYNEWSRHCDIYNEGYLTDSEWKEVARATIKAFQGNGE